MGNCNLPKVLFVGAHIKRISGNRALGSPICIELGLSQTTTVELLYPGGDKSREGTGL